MSTLRRERVRSDVSLLRLMSGIERRLAPNASKSVRERRALLSWREAQDQWLSDRWRSRVSEDRLEGREKLPMKPGRRRDLRLLQRVKRDEIRSEDKPKGVPWKSMRTPEHSNRQSATSRCARLAEQGNRSRTEQEESRKNNLLIHRNSVCLLWSKKAAV